MSVLNCDRYGCGVICCDRHSTKYGYICHTCFDELVKRGIGVDIEAFMDSEATDPHPEPDVQAYFEGIFSSRDD